MYCFASDIHLGAGGEAEARRTERRFVEWLDTVGARADAVFLLGDVFDFWFEYRRVVPRGYVRVLAKIAELTERGVRVVYLTGNHDMWVRGYFASECGMEVFTRPVEMELGGRRVLLAHGDAMNVGRRYGLRLLNAVFRSRVLRFLFSWLVHPDLAMAFGQWWSSSSRRSHAKYLADERCTDPLVEYARSYSAAHPGVDTYVFGHMHVPRDYRDGGLHVLCLGEWEHDPVYAVMDSAGDVSLKRFEL